MVTNLCGIIALIKVGGNMRDAFMRALISQESGGDPNAQNERTKAFGLGQIMPENWGPWAGQYLNNPNAEQTPENQQVVVRGKVNDYFDQFKNPRLVAAAWYAGPGYAQSLQEGKPLFDPNAPQGAGNEPSVNQYMQSVVGKMGIPGVAGAGGPMGPGTSGMTDRNKPQFQSPQGGDMVQGAFMNFMSQYGNKNQGSFDKSILDDMKEAMKPTQHRQQAMGAFLDSMIMLSEGAKKLRNPDFMKDAYSAMGHINTVNMGFADKMAQEEQQAKRMKVGLSAMGKMAEPGTNQSAYGNVFQLATGQKPYESPDAIGAKDVLGAAIQVGNYNRQNAFLDFQKQKLAEQMDMQKQTFELNKAKMGQKQQPTLTDRKTFLEEIKETKEMLGDPKGQAYKQFIEGGGLQNAVALGQQVGIPADTIAGFFGVQAKPRG